MPSLELFLSSMTPEEYSASLEHWPSSLNYREQLQQFLGYTELELDQLVVLKPGVDSLPA